MFDTISYIMGQKAGGGGGGNPNYSKTFTGTMANIMSVAYAGMTDEEKAIFIDVAAYRAGSLSMRMSYDMSAFQFGIRNCAVQYDNLSESTTFAVVKISEVVMSSTGPALAYDATYDMSLDEINYGVKYPRAWSSVAGFIDLSQYAAAIPATLTIYFHDMP